jgi:hypothetical protein
MILIFAAQFLTCRHNSKDEGQENKKFQLHCDMELMFSLMAFDELFGTLLRARSASETFAINFNSRTI